MELREKTNELEMEKDGVDDELEKLIRKVKEKVIMKRRKKREGGVSKYCDGECRRKKKEVGRLLLEWRKGLVDREVYVEGKKEYRSLCEERRAVK